MHENCGSMDHAAKYYTPSGAPAFILPLPDPFRFQNQEVPRLHQYNPLAVCSLLRSRLTPVLNHLNYRPLGESLSISFFRNPVSESRVITSGSALPRNSIMHSCRYLGMQSTVNAWENIGAAASTPKLHSFLQTTCFNPMAWTAIVFPWWQPFRIHVITPRTPSSNTDFLHQLDLLQTHSFFEGKQVSRSDRTGRHSLNIIFQSSRDRSGCFTRSRPGIRGLKRLGCFSEWTESLGRPRRTTTAPQRL